MHFKESFEKESYKSQIMVNDIFGTEPTTACIHHNCEYLPKKNLSVFKDIKLDKRTTTQPLISTDIIEHNNNSLPIKPGRGAQVLAAIAVSLGPLAAGLGKGYASPAIANLQDLQNRHKGNLTNFTVSDQQASWIASLSLLGALFGGLVGGIAMRYGRKRVLTLTSLPFSLSWMLTVFAKSVETMFITAFLAGFCCSIISMVTQVYVSEISSPDVRGFLSAIQKIAGHLGILISFSLGVYLNWRQLALLVAVAPILLFFTIMHIPETPSFLLLKMKDEEAFRSLYWLRGPNVNLGRDLAIMKSNISTFRGNQLYLDSSTTVDSVLKYIQDPFKNVRLTKALMVTCGLMIFQRFTGANSFGFYAVKIFRQTFDGMNPHGGAIAVAVVQLLASMLSGLLIDIVGRIPLLITSSVFMSLALASFGSYIYYEQTSRPSTFSGYEPELLVGNADWIPLLCVLVFTIAFSLGISPISSLLIGEIFPLEYRGLGSAITATFGYFCAFLGVKTFVDFQELLGLHGAFWLYASISCTGLLFIVIVVPETKGRHLDEMDSTSFPYHIKR
ncbi:unnamed protein product [Hermetia illucens]|uniref:Major facilitator superfamily (MFS) profile domain-containing protein n=1 Tax=Hermetia illucens TaxID=343691 RepID=A0A7R8US59_HERIL|nr:facilitated trehalose transporter Tret1-like [Hermetia illucens]CAD7086058.1 unnamed protein product [Hermetia illucens]